MKTIIVLILICLATSSIATATSTAQQYAASKNELAVVKSTFERKIRLEPKNKGASKLLETINKVLTGLDALTTNQLTAEELLPVVENALRDARRFESKDARKVSASLEKLRTTLAGAIDDDEPVGNHDLPSASVTAAGESSASTNEETDAAAERSSRSARRRSVADAASSEVTPVRPVSQQTPASGPSNAVPFLLFVLSAVGTIGVFYYAKNAIEKLGSETTEELKKIRHSVENFEFAGESKDVYTDVLKNDFKKKWDAIENNTAAVFEQIDGRLAAMEKARPESARNGDDPDMKIVIAKLQVLEKKIVAIEDKTAHPAPAVTIDVLPPPPAPVIQPQPAPERYQPPQPQPQTAHRPAQTFSLSFEKLQLLAGYIHSIERKSEQELLKKNAQDLVQKLQTAVTHRNTQTFELTRLAKFIQDIFVAKHFDDISGEYEAIVELLGDSGFEIETRTAGLSAPSDLSAENFSVLAPASFNFHHDPELIALYEHFALQAQNAKFPSGTVVGTLKPTIAVLLENKKAILAKGMYLLA